MESRDSFPGKFPFIVLRQSVVDVCLHTLLRATSLFKKWIYSIDQMQGVRQTYLPSRVNAFVSLYKPI